MAPTLAQLQAEAWWGREIVTPAMDWFASMVCAHFGRPRAAAGIKGDYRHLRGSHRSQEWLEKSIYATSRTYTVQPGLTDTQRRYVAGFDFTPGSGDDMVLQCRRLYFALQAGRLEEVREFYGNVDGDTIVDGWNNVANRVARSDSSHLWHWHLGIDRALADSTTVMLKIFRVVTGIPAPVAPPSLVEGRRMILVKVKGDDTVYVPTHPGYRPMDSINGPAALSKTRAAGVPLVEYDTIEQLEQVTGRNLTPADIDAGLVSAIAEAVRAQIGMIPTAREIASGAIDEYSRRLGA